MKKLLRAVGWVVVLAVSAMAAEDFSKRLSAEDFAAAGLGKLSPEELARLDALVRGERSGELDRVRAETAAKVAAETTAKVKAEARAEAAAKPATEGSLLHRLSVVLAPGTDIAYAAVETTLVGSFHGYEPGQILTLSNGQQWRVIDGRYWSPAKEADKPRKVIIEAGALGSFFLNIEDGGRPKVKIVKNGK